MSKVFEYWKREYEEAVAELREMPLASDGRKDLFLRMESAVQAMKMELDRDKLNNLAKYL